MKTLAKTIGSILAVAIMLGVSGNNALATDEPSGPMHLFTCEKQNSNFLKAPFQYFPNAKDTPCSRTLFFKQLSGPSVIEIAVGCMIPKGSIQCQVAFHDYVTPNGAFTFRPIGLAPLQKALTADEAAMGCRYVDRSTFENFIGWNPEKRISLQHVLDCPLLK